MAELVKGSRRPQPILRKYRQPLYDEEKVGNGVAPTEVVFFTKPRGQQDNAAVTKTERDTNAQAANQLGALQEFYLVGITLNLDLTVMVIDEAGEAPAHAENELEWFKRVFNDSLFTYTFGRQQPLVEIPSDRIPWPRHIQPDQSFNASLKWPRNPGVIGTTADWVRIMCYQIGILLSSI